MKSIQRLVNVLDVGLVLIVAKNNSN